MLKPVLLGGTLLITLAADGVPTFDLTKTCRAAHREGNKAAIDACSRSELAAREQLREEWTQHPAQDRRNCLQLASMGSAPSYNSLIACLESAREIRRIRAKNGGRDDPLARPKR